MPAFLRLAWKKRSRLTAKRERWGYFFTLPIILGLLFFFFRPMVESLRISFGDIRIDGGYTIPFNGLENYQWILTVDDQYIRLLVDSSMSMFINVPIILVISFFVAMLLKSPFRGRTLFRCIFFLPVILSSGVMGSMQMDDIISSMLTVGTSQDVTGEVLSKSQQMISNLLLGANLSPQIAEYILYAINNIISIMNVSGIQILIFLAALQSISPSLYEASAIEGATAWENFWKITLPMVSPQVLVVAVYTIIDSFVSTTNPIMEYIKAAAFDKSQWGESAAMAWLYFLIVIAVLGVFYLLVKRLIFHYEK